uniref:FHA domain-containing protein n=1 Tax=Pyrodinium bahamense TaxID=73915 RepID=A0A7R9ZXX2_9DINO|mmetsp:Transcript_14372/g.39756  ORF Transcript_14372/g.39756 Transcript_14372/m.39756 type:complete len:598 (+) Transcript_14372:134-1927(+)
MSATVQLGRKPSHAGKAQSREALLERMGLKPAAAPARPSTPAKPAVEGRPGTTPVLAARLPGNVAAMPAAAAATSALADRKRFTRIDSFEGIFEFMNLETPCGVAVDGVLHPSAGHAILAAQFPGEAATVANAVSLEEARKAVEGAAEADGWKELMTRLRAMERIQRDKFRRHEDFRAKLQDTGDRELVWVNHDDSFWGMVRGQGSNHLGRVLQEVRESILNGTEFEMWLHMCCEVKDETGSLLPIQLQEVKLVENTKEHIVLHRLNNKTKYTLGKMPANDVVALHPSVSRKHAMIVHTKAALARRTGEVMLFDLGSKSGTSVDGVKLEAPFLMVPLRQGSVIKLGVSTRSYTVKFDISAQIRALEQKERELMQECRIVETEVDDPVAVAKKRAMEASTVWVGNLEYSTTEADLKAFFRDCGEVVEVRIPGKRLDGSATLKANAMDENATRGFAFVVLDSELAARRAVSLSGMSLNERKVNVRIAEARDARPDGAGSKGNGDGKGGGSSLRNEPRGAAQPATRGPSIPAERDAGARQRRLSGSSSMSGSCGRSHRGGAGRRPRSRSRLRGARSRSGGSARRGQQGKRPRRHSSGSSV